MKIYIAGKFTNEPLEPCKVKFLKAEQALRQIDPETISVVNPLKLGIPVTATTVEALPHCFKALRYCSAIYMLNDWVASPGALAELVEAMRCKLDVYYEAHNDIERIKDTVCIEYVRG